MPSTILNGTLRKQCLHVERYLWVSYLSFTKFKFRTVFVEYRENIVSFKCIMRLNV